MKRKTGVTVHPREENPRQVIEATSSTIFVQFHSQRWMHDGACACAMNSVRSIRMRSNNGRERP